MVQDAEAHAEEDRKFHETVTARNNADAIVHATRSSVAELGDKLSDDERKNIETAIEGVETAMKGDDRATIDSAVEKLTTAAQVIYEKAAAAAEAEAGQAEGSTENAPGGEDVVDAEFEEVNPDQKDGK